MEALPDNKPTVQLSPHTSSGFTQHEGTSESNQFSTPNQIANVFKTFPGQSDVLATNIRVSRSHISPGTSTSHLANTQAFSLTAGSKHISMKKMSNEQARRLRVEQ